MPFDDLGGNGATVGNSFLFCQDCIQFGFGLSGLHVNQKIGPLSTDVTVNISFLKGFASTAENPVLPGFSLIANSH